MSHWFLEIFLLNFWWVAVFLRFLLFFSSLIVIALCVDVLILMLCVVILVVVELFRVVLRGIFGISFKLFLFLVLDFLITGVSGCLRKVLNTFFNFSLLETSSLYLYLRRRGNTCYTLPSQTARPHLSVYIGYDVVVTIVLGCPDKLSCTWTNFTGYLPPPINKY